MHSRFTVYLQSGLSVLLTSWACSVGRMRTINSAIGHYRSSQELPSNADEVALSFTHMKPDVRSQAEINMS
ncbi:uncharacterized protein BCR38DRAFT_423023 [Pseudomassariella vexata]|uniref:Secreted protein n=1 Tax=Pseudomassariella vexata TaxID=1141098 RepID=A0A1Y2E9W7_9PEZI|nr:uncharacterized protein BCR38DRAFT_423023 [Pseudomassariella vexata]ORY68378.1 hypothetical protein BCR38DRAFT_423023 [Pseudomassariella vexata]